MKAYKTGQGNWQLNFSLDGVQKTLYLGKRYTESSSERVSKLVTEIVDIRNRGDSLTSDQYKKILLLPNRIQKSLHRLGLIVVDKGLTLQEFFDKFIETKRGMKAKTRKFYRDWFKRFFHYFDTKMLVSSINKDLATKFIDCCNDNLSLCTVSRGVGACRTIFDYAVTLGILGDNPFKYIVRDCKATNISRQYYVERKMITKILEKCNDDRDRLIIVLARFGGLRIPSEIQKLRFCDFTDKVIKIHEDTKTGSREVPFFREIKEVFNRLSGKPQELVFPDRYGKNWYPWQMLSDCIERAGFERWEKLYVNMRSSCITDMDAIGYPEKALDAVFGNSVEVRRAHYLQLQKEKVYNKILADNELLNLSLQSGDSGTKIMENINSYDKILELRDFLVSVFGVGKLPEKPVQLSNS
jgi:site-specific recombinase XerD